MTTTPPSPPQPEPDREPFSTAPLRRSRRLWIAAALVIGLCILVPLVILQTAQRRGTHVMSPEQGQERQRLLELGAALKQYAAAHDNALPEEVPASAAQAAAGATYRAVTPSGERLRHESFGDRVVAWTEPDADGRRAVLLNSLDEVERVADAELNLTEQRRTDGGPLNRVRIVTPEGEGEGEAEEEADPATGPATAPATKEGD